MRQILLIVTLIMMLPAIVHAEHLPGCPATSHTPEQCAALIETEILKKHKDLFQRNNEKLIINLKNGKTETYITNLSDSFETYHVYLLVHYYDSVNYALILDGYYEGHSFYLLNIATGASWDVEGFALLSPNKQRFVVYEKDIDAEYSPNVLRIFQIKPDGLLLEFDAVPFKWGPTNVRWINDKEITFSKDSYDVDSPYYSKETHEAREPKRLKNLDGKWTIVN